MTDTRYEGWLAVYKTGKDYEAEVVRDRLDDVDQRRSAHVLTGRGLRLAMEEDYHPPVKRSVTIAGHPTSITLEPLFWRELERLAADRSLPLSALIAQIDAQRIAADEPPNLASAIRIWLYRHGAGGR